jgi:hypothetical protein
MRIISLILNYSFIVTLTRLGIYSVFQAFLYKLCRYLRIFILLDGKNKPGIKEDFFRIEDVLSNSNSNKHLVHDPKGVDFIDGYYWYFDAHRFKVSDDYNYNWFLNPWNSNIHTSADRHWSLISDSDHSNGDIKIIWELSRFKWILSLAYNFRVSSNFEIIRHLNSTISQWLESNPFYLGPNWMCGQEVSLRVNTLILVNDCYFNLNGNSSESILTFIKLSISRIEQTLNYALAQSNNHSISEASAIYIGGLFLNQHNPKVGLKYVKKGKMLLEKSIKKLIATDGSFAQHSTNYHRMVLDTLCLVEIFRRRYDGQLFSSTFYNKFKSALKWLIHFTPGENGEAWNLGSNDGSNILHFPYSEYYDYRPTIQLSHLLCYNNLINGFPSFQQEFSIYGISEDSFVYNTSLLAKSSNTLVLDHSYLVLSQDNLSVFCKLPFYQFRPAQNDAHHIDVWYKGVNLFIDSGTYSYCESGKNDFKLKSAYHHNCVNFDDYEPMRPIGRFLLTDWFRSKKYFIDKEFSQGLGFSSEYRDRKGNIHRRELIIDSSGNLTIMDDVHGKFRCAVLNFHLNSSIVLNKYSNGLETDLFSIKFNKKIRSIERSSYSTNYLKLEDKLIISIVLNSSEQLKTVINFK